MQIKKQLPPILLFIACAFVIFFLPVNAQTLKDGEIAATDVADNQSVIDEQQYLSLSGGMSLVNTSVTIEDIQTQIEVEQLEVYIVEEEVPLSPYVGVIDNLTEEEKDILLKITFAEAGNQSMEGQRAVIEVILNRILSEDFPNNLVDVLSQDGQFATWKYHKNVTYNEEQELALALVYSEVPILSCMDYVFFAKSRYNYANDYVQIGDHWFGTLE